MRFCFVVHRYAPFPGGTEIYVQALAEESLRRGHEVWVYADRHLGGLNGVNVTSDSSVLQSNFDLIVVHGKTARAQKYVLRHCNEIPAPVLYLLVAHGTNFFDRKGIAECSLAGWSTPDDLAILRSCNALDKSCPIRHGVQPATSLGRPGFRDKYEIPSHRRVFVSCGGYWAHKRMRQLAAVFEKAKTDALLVTTGYHKKLFQMPRRSRKVLPLLLEDREEALSAIREADVYVMHSLNEGFGLVLLEAMLNRTPWIAHRVGGAEQLKEFGDVYDTDEELMALIEGAERNEDRIDRAESFVRSRHLIEHAVDDIEAASRRAALNPRNIKLIESA